MSQTKAKIKLPKDIFKKYPSEVILEASKIIDKYVLEKSKTMSDKKRDLANFKTFVNTYFSHYLTVPFGKIQNEIISDIEKLRDRKNRLPIRESLAAPRGYAKSSLVTLMGVIWLILNKEHFFIIILSSTKNTAQGFLQAIIDETEQNEKLLDDYPELMPAKDFKNQTVAWRDSEIVFANGVRIMALGWLNSVRGLRKKNKRPDLIIGDDPDEEKDVASETRMVRKYRWFDRAVLRLGGIIGVDVFICYTTIAQNCVGEYIYNDEHKYSDWTRKKFKAIEIDSKGSEYSTWQEAYSIEDLQKEREEDPLGFSTERQNEAVSEIDQKFKGIIQTYEYSSIQSWQGYRLVLAVDLSLGKTEKSDFSAIIGVAMTPEGKYLQIYESIERRPPSKIGQDIIAALQLYDYSICGIEGNGNQEHFQYGFNMFLEEYNRNTPKKINTPIETINNSGDKIKRIEASLQPLVQSGWLKLRDDSQMLFKQLNDFPYSKKDGPDALSMCIELFPLIDKDKKTVVVSQSKPVTSNKFDWNRFNQDRVTRMTRK